MSKIIIFISLLYLLSGCQKELEELDYLRRLRVGDTLSVDCLKSPLNLLRVKRDNGVIITYTNGMYYITVNPKNNKIKAIWSK